MKRNVTNLSVPNGHASKFKFEHFFSHNYHNFSMFRHVPGCSGMFQDVAGCSIFLVLSTAYKNPLIAIAIVYFLQAHLFAEEISRTTTYYVSTHFSLFSLRFAFLVINGVTYIPTNYL